MANAIDYAEQINRLALGLEVLDAANQRPLVYPLRVDVEYGLPHQPPSPKDQYSFQQRPGRLARAMSRHNSGRYSLVYQPGFDDHIDLRLYDHYRQYVPRRLRLPLLSLAVMESIETNEEADYVRGRIRRPVMFPGAAYDLVSRATGLRGRVLRDGQPMPWAWIEAYSMADDELVGRARGDERGEFLLLINPLVASAGDLAASYGVRVEVFGPTVVPSPASADLPSQDLLWDLPIETVPQAGDPDEVTPGESKPAGYVEGASEELTLITGRVLTGVEIDDFVFSVA